MSHKISRRSFITKSATVVGLGAFGATAGSRMALAQSAAEPINVGLIGVGWRGGQLLGDLGKLPGVRVAALCDPESKFLEQPRKDHPQAKVHADLRHVLDDPSIQAVVIATCNHWHCLAAVWACQAGKDVYVEKPLSHELWEGRQLVNAARKYDRIAQIGTQQRSDPMQDEIRAFLHDDKALGEIRSVVVTRFGVRESIGKRDTPLEPPKTLVYDLWLGPAADQPIYRNKIDYDWHWDWNTGNGECANWGVHILDDVRNIVFNDRVTLPSEVACGGGRVLWNDAGNTPNLQFAYFKAGDTPVYFALSNLPVKPGERGPLRFENVESGYIVQCEGGSYHGMRGYGVALDPAGEKIKEFRGDSGAGHLANFFQAVRERDRRMLNSEVAIGHASTNWAHAINSAWRSANRPGLVPDAGPSQASSAGGEIRELMRNHMHAYFPESEPGAIQMSRLLTLDPDKEQFVGDGADEANKYLGPRDYRAPYVLQPVSV